MLLTGCEVKLLVGTVYESFDSTHTSESAKDIKKDLGKALKM